MFYTFKRFYKLNMELFWHESITLTLFERIYFAILSIVISKAGSSSVLIINSNLDNVNVNLSEKMLFCAFSPDYNKVHTGKFGLLLCSYNNCTAVHNRWRSKHFF